MDLFRIALRVAGYDFKTKMKLNVLVIQELARLSGLEDTNTVAELIADSPIHNEIQALANVISDEAEKMKPSAEAK